MHDLNNPVKRPLLAFAGILLALLLGFVPALGLHDWWYPDEPDVVLPAIEMARRADWVVPTHNGVAWLDYPPLAYWGARLFGLGLGGGSAEGITPFASRLPSVLFAGFMLLATWLIGRRFLGERPALLAAGVLLATPLMWFQITTIQADIGYAGFQALGMALYLVGDARSGTSSCFGSWLWRIAGFACFGAAMLGKGPLGVLLPGLILTCWHVWNREWRRILELAPLALVSLLVALPWYLFLINRIGFDTVAHELYLQNFDRFGSSNRGHGGKGFFYYFSRIAADFAPWVVLLVGALIQGVRTRSQDRGWRLLAIWAVVPVIFFTCASTKRNVYLLPIYPAFALLVAHWLMRAEGAWATAMQTWMIRLLSGVLAIAGVALLVAGAAWTWLPLPAKLNAELLTALRPAAFVLGIILAAGGLWSLRPAWSATSSGARLPAWYGVAATMVIAWSAIMWTVLPPIDRVRTYRPAAQWLAERVPASGTVGFYQPGREAPKRPAWLCHLGGRTLTFFATAEAASAWLIASPGRLLLTNRELAGTLSAPVAPLITWQISSETWVVVSAPGPAPAP